MQINEGFADRVVRVLLGLLVLSSFFFVEHTPLLYVLLVPFGLVPLLTGIFGICPLYTVLGVNTLGKKANE